MKQFAKLAKMVQMEKTNEVAAKFLDDLIYTIEQANKSDYIPTRSYKPSGIGSCKRALFYQMTGSTPDGESGGQNLVGICESGTHRHEDIQEYVIQMKSFGIDCEWIDVGKYLEEQGIEDPVVVKKNGYETKLYSKKYNMRFMCDGLIKYKGEYYVLEIKTESSRKFDSHTEPHKDHKLQAACYSMNLQVDNVLFLYENRDNCNKKAYLFKVPEPMKDKIAQVIKDVDTYVANNEVPPKETDKCLYCNYKKLCAKERR